MKKMNLSHLSWSAKMGIGALAVFAAVGVGLWIMQINAGLGVTGMNNSNSWGLYIAMFMFFVGLSAGGLIVASSAHVFHIEAFQKVAIPAVITSIVCICAAGWFVLIDLGGIMRIWRIVAQPHFTSPLLWDMCVITTYLIINILDLVWLVRGEHRRVAILSYIALPVAILVHSVTAWIFGLQIAKAWYSAIMAPIFVASACDSGLALLLVVLVALHGSGLFRMEQDLLVSLGRLLAVFVAVDAFFIGCEVLTMAYPGGHEAQVLSEMLFGRTAPFFWFEVIGGLLVPFLILVQPRLREQSSWVVAASLLIVFGVFCKRMWLLFTSFIYPNFEGGAGITLGTRSAQADPYSMWTYLGSYVPSAVEMLIVIGVICVSVLAIGVLARLFVHPHAE